MLRIYLEARAHVIYLPGSCCNYTQILVILASYLRVYTYRAWWPRSGSGGVKPEEEETSDPSNAAMQKDGLTLEGKAGTNLLQKLNQNYAQS